MDINKGNTRPDEQSGLVRGTYMLMILVYVLIMSEWEKTEINWLHSYNVENCLFEFPVNWK